MLLQRIRGILNVPQPAQLATAKWATWQSYSRDCCDAVPASQGRLHRAGGCTCGGRPPQELWQQRPGCQASLPAGRPSPEPPSPRSRRSRQPAACHGGLVKLDDSVNMASYRDWVPALARQWRSAVVALWRQAHLLQQSVLNVLSFALHATTLSWQPAHHVCRALAHAHRCKKKPPHCGKD